jgi:hypothetical protein
VREREVEWVAGEQFPRSDMLIFICPRHEVSYAGHLLSVFQAPLMPVYAHSPPPLLGAWTFLASFLLCDLPALSTALSKGQPRGGQRLRTSSEYGYLGTKLWDHFQKTAFRLADLILSRFSFQSSESQFGHGCWSGPRTV